MSEERFKIVYRGDIGFGWSREEVADNLKRRFRFSDAAIEKLLSGKAVTLKKELPQEKARRLADALEEAGAPCSVEAMTPKPKEGDTPSLQLADSSAKEESPTPEEAPEVFMTCPQCGQQQKEAETCTVCGVDVADYRERQPGQSGATGVFAEGDGFTGPGLIDSDGLAAALAGTRPWVRLISVLMFICAALMIVVTGATFLAGGMQGAPMALIAPFQALNIVIYLFPAYFLFKYARAIGVFLERRGTGELEAALGYQKSFWKFIGILTLIGLLLAVAGIVAAIALPGFFAGLQG